MNTSLIYLPYVTSAMSGLFMFWITLDRSRPYLYQSDVTTLDKNSKWWGLSGCVVGYGIGCGLVSYLT